jgi:hypothetical protein
MQNVSLKTPRFFTGCLLTALFCGLLIQTGCSHKEDHAADPDVPATAVTVKNLPADPVTYDPSTGAPMGGTNRYTLFRFSDSTIVQNSDSATSHWDIGFRGTDIIINGAPAVPVRRPARWGTVFLTRSLSRLPPATARTTRRAMYFRTGSITT